MHFYPRYDAVAVLEMPAVTFFALLNECYRLIYADALLAAHIGDLAHMEPPDRKKFYRQLEWASMHPSDILKPEGQGSTPNEIKKLLGGK